MLFAECQCKPWLSVIAAAITLNQQVTQPGHGAHMALSSCDCIRPTGMHERSSRASCWASTLQARCCCSCHANTCRRVLLHRSKRLLESCQIFCESPMQDLHVYSFFGCWLLVRCGSSCTTRPCGLPCLLLAGHCSFKPR
jgi:hypothetical protein